MEKIIYRSVSPFNRLVLPDSALSITTLHLETLITLYQHSSPQTVLSTSHGKPLTTQMPQTIARLEEVTTQSSLMTETMMKIIWSSIPLSRITRC